jgi:hypothetical protein
MTYKCVAMLEQTRAAVISLQRDARRRASGEPKVRRTVISAKIGI